MKMRVQTLPTKSQCRTCINIAESYAGSDNEIPKCSECHHKKLANLIQIEKGYGYVIIDDEDKIRKIDLDYIKLLDKI